MTTITPMSQRFIKESHEATSFDWDKNSYPAPEQVEELFNWLDENAAKVNTLPAAHGHPAHRTTIVEFNDDSSVTIRTNILSDYIDITEGTDEHPAQRPYRAIIHRNSRPAYTYFNHIMHKQRQRTEDDGIIPN